MTEEKEVWKAIPDYEGIYEVSNQGRARRIMFRNGSGYKASKPPKVLSPGVGKYKRLRLSKDNYSHQFSVHRLVLLAFVGPCPPGYECAHLNGNPHDNRAENLQWVTRKENHSHKKLHGTWQGGENSGHSKLKFSEVQKIRKLRESGKKLEDIGRKFGVTGGYVSVLCAGRKRVNT